MVLIKRCIEPATRYVQFEATPATVPKDKIQMQVTQSSMCALLDQISLLFHHANDSFCEIMRDANKTYERIMMLASRVEQFSELVPQIETYLEACSTDTLLPNPRQDFRSKPAEEDQHLLVESRPTSIVEVYERCKLPPNLSIMDAFSEDGQPCIRKFTNPAFFIEQWVMEQQKQHEEARKRRDARRKEKKDKPTQVTGRNQQKKVVQQVQLRRKQLNAMGKEFSNTTSLPTSSAAPTSPPVATTSTSGSAIHSRPAPAATPRPAAAPKVQPAPPTQPRPAIPQQPISAPSSLPPPPPPSSLPATPTPAPAPPKALPPPPASVQQSVSVQPSASVQPSVPAQPFAPAAPPAPPATPVSPPRAPGPPPPPAPPVHRAESGAAGLSLADRLAAKKDGLVHAPEQPVKAPVDKKSALLEQIRTGAALKKVEKNEEEDHKKPVDALSGPSGMAFNVSKILARRDAIMGLSDSDEEEGGWDD